MDRIGRLGRKDARLSPEGRGQEIAIIVVRGDDSVGREWGHSRYTCNDEDRKGTIQYSRHGYGHGTCTWRMHMENAWSLRIDFACSRAAALGRACAWSFFTYKQAGT